MKVTIPRELPIKSINTNLKPDTDGNVDITKSTVGLNNVDNTSDAGKPISTATQNALNLKAPLASPALTGTPTAPTAASGTSSTQIATTEFVMNAFRANDAMIYKGTIGSSGATVTSLPSIHYQGWTYKVITAGTYAGVKCEIGDMIICITDGVSDTDSHWSVVQSNIDGAVTGPASSTTNHVVTFNGNSGKVIKDSGYTIGKSVPSNAVFTDTNTTYILEQSEDDDFTLVFTPSDGSEATRISLPNTSTADMSKVTGTLAIANGGTGATTAADARTALGLGAAATKGTVSSITTSNNLPTSTAVKNYVTKTNVGLGNVANIDQSKAIKSIVRSGTTFTVTYLDNTTGTFDQQDLDTWIAMTGATSSADGSAGYVPAPPKTGYNSKYLRADGTWTTPPNDNTTYSGTSPINVSGNSITHESSGVTAGSKGDTSAKTPAFGGTFKAISATVNATGHVTSLAEHTVKIPATEATTTTAGLMSAADKTKLDGVVNTAVKGNAESTYRTGNVNITKANIGLGNVDNTSDANKPVSTAMQTELDKKVNASDVGVAGGVASLGDDGKVPSAQLPSYVDDVLEYTGSSSFPSTGEAGKIYVDTSTNKTYRWSGTQYVEISPSLALGETSSTAYRGDRGKTAYDHASAKGSAFASGLYKITTNAQGHVTAATAVTKDDITGLGIPGSNTNTTYTLTQDSSDGHKLTFTPSSGTATTITIPDNNTTYTLSSITGTLAVNKGGTGATTAADARTNLGLGGAAVKGVVTSVDSSASLPTSGAVKTFVEGKGYVTSSGVTSVATGKGLTGGTITGTGTIKANLVSETNLTNAASAATEVAGRVYPVAVDKNSKLAVNVPWTDTNTVTDLQYDSTNNKITKTIDGTTTDVVDVATIKSAMSLGAASNKAVDTSIAAASTSTNLPTSAAVASFVEGKGYKTTDNDTKNTAGTTNKAATKLFIAGATSQAANPVTYSNSSVYIGTDNCLYSNGTKVLTAHQDISGKANKSETVSTVAYDSTNNKITKTINGTTSDVVSVATIKTAMGLSKSDVGLGNVDNTSDAAKPISTATQTALNNKLSTSLKGAANGLAELDSNGKVPSSQLPSYVDDVLEYTASSSFPETGETGKIYVDTGTNKTYRWSGTSYVEISASLALGTTSSTAYRGDYGAAAYKHGVTNKGSAFSSGLYKITTNAEGHVTAATAVTKTDITNLGIPGSNTNTTYTLTQDSTNGHKITLTPSTGTATTITIPDNNTTYTLSSITGTLAVAKGGTGATTAAAARTNLGIIAITNDEIDEICV